MTKKLFGSFIRCYVLKKRKLWVSTPRGKFVLIMSLCLNQSYQNCSGWLLTYHSGGSKMVEYLVILDGTHIWQWLVVFGELWHLDENTDLEVVDITLDLRSLCDQGIQIKHFGFLLLLHLNFVWKMPIFFKFGQKFIFFRNVDFKILIKVYIF